MSTNGDDSGSKDRATVALVDAKVATVQVSVDALTHEVRAGFKDMRDLYAALPILNVKVEGVSDRLLVLEGRVTTIERARSYRVNQLPTLLLAFGGLVLTAINIYLVTHVH